LPSHLADSALFHLTIAKQTARNEQDGRTLRRMGMEG
jgi:hypothetical protein